jgi:hypothetical protein
VPFQTQGNHFDDDTLENLEELGITIGQFDVEKPSTKEAIVLEAQLL